MVIAPTCVLWAIALAAAADPTPPASASTTTAEPAAKALARGNYPWYDAQADALKPVEPPAQPIEPKVRASSPSSGTGAAFDLGQLIVFVLIALGLAALIALIAWAWSRGQFASDPVPAPTGPARSPTRVGDLPAGLTRIDGDPLAEAARLRASGDYAGAIVCLFAHQLLALDRHRLARLMPGRTGRQLVRSVANATVRDLVTPALRLFEEVYYGHNPPSAEAFEAVWEQAQTLERMLAAGGLR